MLGKRATPISWESGVHNCRCGVGMFQHSLARIRDPSCQLSSHSFFFSPPPWLPSAQASINIVCDRPRCDAVKLQGWLEASAARVGLQTSSSLINCDLVYSINESIAGLTRLIRNVPRMAASFERENSTLLWFVVPGIEKNKIKMEAVKHTLRGCRQKAFSSSVHVAIICSPYTRVFSHRWRPPLGPRCCAFNAKAAKSSKLGLLCPSVSSSAFRPIMCAQCSIFSSFYSPFSLYTSSVG